MFFGGNLLGYVWVCGRRGAESSLLQCLLLQLSKSAQLLRQVRINFFGSHFPRIPKLYMSKKKYSDKQREFAD